MTRVPPSTHLLSEWLKLRSGRGQGAASKYYNTLSLMEVGPPPPPVVRVSGRPEKGLLSTFATPFSQEIIEAPCSKKVKMPSVELFDGTIDPDDHKDVYKA